MPELENTPQAEAAKKIQDDDTEITLTAIRGALFRGKHVEAGTDVTTTFRHAKNLLVSNRFAFPDSRAAESAKKERAAATKPPAKKQAAPKA